MPAEYQPYFVIISIVIAIISACISLAIMDGVNALPKRLKHLRLVSAGIAFAAGTWAMHFVGMLAVTLPMPLVYSPGLTFASYLFSIMGAIPAMVLISVKKKKSIHQLNASILLATAISIMHYSGMASMSLQPAIAYDSLWVFGSLFIAFLASYISLYIINIQESNNKKKWWVFYRAGVVLGIAVSVMHYSAMEAVSFDAHSVSLTVRDASALEGKDLVYVVVSASLLVMILLIFSSLNVINIILWKVLAIIAISELTIMLILPVILPENTPNMVVAILDVILLLIFIFPIAWRIRVNGLDLLDNNVLIEKNLEAQQATNSLLALPIHDLSMEDFLNTALRTIHNVSWLKTLPQGAIFLNNPGEKSLSMVAEYNLAVQISLQCASVKYGQCLCGMAAETLSIQHHSHVNCAHSVRFEGMQDHGHYNMPMILEGVLYGVICLYLSPGQPVSENEKSILHSFAVTIAELISHKQALEYNELAKTVFENNLTCLVIADAGQKILNVNPCFTRVTGYTEKEIIGQSLVVLKSGKHDIEFYQELRQALEESDSWEGEIWNTRKNGEPYPQWTRIAVVRDNLGRIKNHIASFDDISLRKAAEEHISQLAYYDSLTSLPNRSLFYDRLEQAIIKAERAKNKIAILFIDLDRFKEVNDTFGHEAGDALLKAVAIRASFCLRSSDTLARLGGDEFVVILCELEGDKHYVTSVVQNIVSKILEKLCTPYDFQDKVLHSGASIGVVIYPDNAENIHQLIQQADTAMYEAKNAGRNTYRFFSQEMMECVKRRHKISQALRVAIEAGTNELSLVYQPLIDTLTQQTIGAEALLRWHSIELGVVPTLEFIPFAEEMGFIGGMGEWVLEQACLQYKQWQNEGVVKLEYIAVNVSIYQLISIDFANKALQICEKAGVATEHIELEITEGGLAQYPESITEVLHQLRSFGFKLAIDDFGTDYSSLTRLKAFNVDLLKIDRTFIRDMTEDEDDATIVRAIIDLGAALGLTTLAEGVETIEQFELLKSYGCTRCQGYYFGRPISAEQFSENWQK
ncbi:MAG: EAL domain-containing protein [Methyloprofundus sp.]|nr:EAL domain-containing protein [Methyloprofundus sp.]